jgi:peptidoglycan/LPS O-acetylase OafA/YrhL
MKISCLLLCGIMNFQRLSLPSGEWNAKNGQIIPSLDGIRACSVIIVLLGHMVLPAKFIGISALGLDVFFMVSGFLITRLFFAECRAAGEVNLRLFYLRRLLRLYPVLIVYMLLVISVQLARRGPIDWLEIASVFFYFWNYLTAHQEWIGHSSPFPIGVLWSLSVEEHFYLFAPLVFVVVRGSAVAMLRFAIVVCAACLLLRYAYVAIWPGIEHTLWIYRHSETRVDSIAFGVALASLCEFAGGQRLVAMLASRAGVAIGFLILLASYAIRDAYFQNTLRFTIQGLALMPLVAGVVFGQPFRFANSILNSPPLVWVGRLSYSLYIWHGGVFFLFGTFLVMLSTPLKVGAEVGLTFLLAVVSYYVVERPALRFRKYLHNPVTKGSGDRGKLVENTPASTAPSAIRP